MGFIDSLTEGLGGGVAGSIFGGIAAQQGAGINLSTSKAYEQHQWQQAQKRGLTPQEYYGSPAPGANVSNTGASQVLGNSMDKMSANMAQLGQQERQKDLDRDNAIAITDKNNQTAKDIAQIQAGVSTRGQDITAKTAASQLELEARKHNEIGLKRLAQDLKIGESELKQRAIKLITESPAFLREMKRLSMGTENMYVETVLRSFGITDFAQIETMQPNERRKLMNRMLAGSSTIAKNLAALRDTPELDPGIQGGSTAIEQMRAGAVQFLELAEKFLKSGGSIFHNIAGEKGTKTDTQLGTGSDSAPSPGSTSGAYKSKSPSIHYR